MSTYREYRRYLLAHPDKLEHRRSMERIYSMKYRAKYKQRLADKQRLFYKEHPEKSSEYHRRWINRMRSENPLKYEAQLECNRAKTALFRKQNPTYAISRDRKYRGIVREVIARSKMKPCFDCRVQYNPWVMQFDHRNPIDKSFGIGGFMRYKVSLDKVLKEIEKCDVVCANCHAERTHRLYLAGQFDPNKLVLSNQ